MRKWFYLLMGFTFPFFWTFHSMGKMKVLYYPIQKMTSTTSTGWPSFVSASLLYIVVCIAFEATYRARKNMEKD